MFYELPEKYDKAFRFGDVLQGFAVTTPFIHNPPISTGTSYHIEVSMHSFYVILTPCCSISDKVLALAPLLKLKNSFFGNPYFKEDITRLNKKMEAKNRIPPQAWDKMNANKKNAEERQGLTYACIEFFIYKENDLFQTYTVDRKDGNITARDYMIDFRTIFQVRCDKVVTTTNIPFECKRLQLTIDTRNLLRDKLMFYFSRMPNEDKASMI